MARRKKHRSLKLELANARAAGMESIDPKLDLGNGLTLTNYKSSINETSGSLNRYNTMLSQADEANNEFVVAEKAMADMSDRMLAGVAAKHGRDSEQYEMAGGTRPSARRKAKKPEAPAAKTPAAAG